MKSGKDNSKRVRRAGGAVLAEVEEPRRLSASGRSASFVQLTARLQVLAEQVAAPLGIEIVEIELKGSGRSHLLRIYIDKPEGVTHTDCELISRELSALLDVEDPIPGSYELEVSSPGVERKLAKLDHWRRFTGKKANIVLKDTAAQEVRHFEGVISRVDDAAATIAVELPDGALVVFPFDQVDHANLKFEW